MSFCIEYLLVVFTFSLDCGKILSLNRLLEPPNLAELNFELEATGGKLTDFLCGLILNISYKYFFPSASFLIRIVPS